MMKTHVCLLLVFVALAHGLEQCYKKDAKLPNGSTFGDQMNTCKTKGGKGNFVAIYECFFEALKVVTNGEVNPVKLKAAVTPLLTNSFDGAWDKIHDTCDQRSEKFAPYAYYASCLHNILKDVCQDG